MNAQLERALETNKSTVTIKIKERLQSNSYIIKIKERSMMDIDTSRVYKLRRQKAQFEYVVVEATDDARG